MFDIRTAIQPTLEDSPQILVVDDDAVARRLLTISLERAGFIVESFGSGEEALSFIEERTPDVLVLDFEMPGINGAEVCARLRSSETVAIKELPVIMLTGHSTETEELACLRACVNDFVTKPISRAVLQARIQTQLRLRAYAKEMEKWKEAKREDLKAASAIQQAMMPANFPKIKGWEVEALYQPLIEVGGDI